MRLKDHRMDQDKSESSDKYSHYATVERVKDMIETYTPRIVKAEIITILQTIGINLSTFETTNVARGAIEWAIDSVSVQSLRKKERYKAVMLGLTSLLTAIIVPFVLWVITKYKSP